MWPDVDQAALLVRVTARVSAAVFAASLVIAARRLSAAAPDIWRDRALARFVAAAGRQNQPQAARVML
jgi:hypothetical protein